MKRKYLYGLGFVMLLFASCMDDEDWYAINTNELPPADTISARQSFDSLKHADSTSSFQSLGVFIVNQGNYMYDNASLGYYQPGLNKAYQQVFFNKNKLPLGDVAQSIVVRDSLAYIVVNNSGKIYVINTKTYQYTGKITGLTSPRYMHFINPNKAYVTDLYARKIAIVNPSSLTITGYIDVNNQNHKFYQHSTDQMVQYGKYVFTNCWSYDNKILVIDSETDQLIDSIEVLIQPQSMVIDKYGKLWVLTDGGSKGNPIGHEAPGLIQVDATTRTIEKTIRFSMDESPRSLKINHTADTLFYINRHIYRLAINAGNEPEILIHSNYSASYIGGFYSLGIDPVNTDIYVGDAVDFAKQGSVYRYNSKGIDLDTFKVGIIPGEFGFID